jgi:hypothetical protein
MYRKEESGPQGYDSVDFPLREVKGRWASREGAPGVRIVQNRRCRVGGFYLELTYRTGKSYRRLIRKHPAGVRYFDLYGFVGLAYDPERDVLQLSYYGEYYRVED